MLRPQQTEHRASLSLDGLWAFRFQMEGETALGWECGFETDRVAAVPSSFNDLFVTSEERNHWGPVWYQRAVVVPGMAKGQRLFLHFQAAAYRAMVWLDGRELGHHETGHTPFEFEVTRLMKPGRQHRLVVRVDTRLTPDCVPPGELSMPGTAIHMGGNQPPGNFDFYPYGGLQRSVSLIVVPEQHLDQILVDTQFNGDDACVMFRIWSCGGARVAVTIEETGEQARADIASDMVSLDVHMASPRRWDVGRGALYHAHVELLDEFGLVLDSYCQRFGCREVSIDGEQLLLNGHPVCLKGFGRHEDFHILGRGHNDAVMVRDFELMKWTGANSFRTSHYPYAEQQLDLADQLGFLVIDESPAVGIVPDLATERLLATHCTVQREYMLRDYNHPSVIAWSVANEPHSEQASAPAYFEQVVKTAREVDSSRPIMMVTCFADRDRCAHLFDMVGFNCYFGWYGGGGPMPETLQALSRHLDNVREWIPGKPLMVSEFGAGSIAGFHALPAELWTEEYQAELLQESIRVMRTKPWLQGEHVWTLCDFKTGQNDRRVYGNRKGVFTRERHPKAAAHALRAVWRDLPEQKK
jgi:beta-glucuronidase